MWAIVAHTLVVVALVAALGGVVFFIVRRRRRDGAWVNTYAALDDEGQGFLGPGDSRS